MKATKRRRRLVAGSGRYRLSARTELGLRISRIEREGIERLRHDAERMAPLTSAAQPAGRTLTT